MKQHEIITVNCPTCQKSIEWSDKYPYRPFCSKRCQLIDLGEWASESHRIPTNEADEQDIWSEDETAQFMRKDD